jgi:hypothetical protein
MKCGSWANPIQSGIAGINFEKNSALIQIVETRTGREKRAALQ